MFYHGFCKSGIWRSLNEEFWLKVSAVGLRAFESLIKVGEPAHEASVPHLSPQGCLMCLHDKVAAS